MWAMRYRRWAMMGAAATKRGIFVRKILLLLTAVLLIGGLTGCRFPEDKDLNRVTTQMIEALERGDSKQVVQLTHADHRWSDEAAQGYIAALREDGSMPSGDVYALSSSNRRYDAAESGYEGWFSTADYDATIGEGYYSIKVSALKNDNGYGIIEFSIAQKLISDETEGE